jgi:hypothetical protein
MLVMLSNTLSGWFVAISSGLSVVVTPITLMPAQQQRQ